MNDQLRFEVRPSKDGQFYFVQLAKNNRVLSTSETYKRKKTAVDAAWSAGATEVFEVVDGEKEYFEMDDQEAKPSEEEKEAIKPQTEPANAGVVENKRGTGDMPPEGDEVAPEHPDQPGETPIGSHGGTPSGN